MHLENAGYLAAYFFSKGHTGEPDSMHLRARFLNVA